MPLNFELLRILVAIGGTGVAAYQDARTSFIDEKLMYALIAAGLLLNLATLELNFILYSLAGAAVIFGVGYFFYRNGQVGGGDVLLYTAIQLLLPFRPNELIALELGGRGLLHQAVLEAVPFFVSVFTSASFFALLGSALLYAGKINWRKPKPDLVVGGVSGAAALFFLAWLYLRGASAAQLGFFTLVLLPAVFLMAFKKQITDEVVVQRIPLSKVEDEDILLTDKLDKKIVEKYSIGRVLTRQEVEKLKRIGKKEGIKLFPVAKVLPRLGPYVLLGLISSLLLGDLFAFFLIG